MKNEKEKWIQGVFDSMEGSERAKPSAQLFAKIEHQIDQEEGAKLISINQWRWSAAAAVVLLLVNVFAMRNLTQANMAVSDEFTVGQDASQQLISNYKIYE